jgi:four helix bundle protein
MRDPHKLSAFQLADQLVVAVYKHTANMPPDERFGLTMQIRRAAVSIPSNIVEGCSRNSESEYLRFLDIALGSACELEYQLSLALRRLPARGPPPPRCRPRRSDVQDAQRSHPSTAEGLTWSLRSGPAASTSPRWFRLGRVGLGGRSPAWRGSTSEGEG